MKNVLSIQSWAAFGHVGNASAMFPLPRLGVEVWVVNTVQFSNHTGYGKWRGTVFTGDMVREIVTGIDERGVLGSCDGVLSGYMGDAGIGEAILEAVAKVKAANPSALYCCEPVIGDVGRGVFVRPGIPEFMREHAVPAVIVCAAIVRARRLSRATMRNIRENLLFAFVYNAAGIPVAASVLYPLFGILLSPIIAAAAMALSSVSVIANAARLRRAALS